MPEGQATLLVPQLPAEMTPFVGRRTELRQLGELLSGARLVTLVGPGGVGKTRVALRAAAQAAAGYADGLCLAELSSLGDPQLLPHTVARQLGLPELTTGSQLEVVLGHLRDRQLLLILDTCEHLIDACADFVTAVLTHAPGVTVLATSREPLDIDGETTFHVPPLPVPGAGRAGTMEPFGKTGFEMSPEQADGDAVELFVQRAAAVLGGFALTPENRAQVISICRRLDGIPLAIELAAVRLRALPLAELADWLQRRLPQLGGYRTESRHQTLRDAVAWSYDLCSSPEQVLWARLSVFAGSFDLAAAEEICASGMLSKNVILETIVRLVDKSVLLRADPPPGGQAGEPRFRMLDTIREFGAERLAASGDETAIRNRCIARYLSLARYFRDHLVDDDQLERFRELRREHANLRAVLEYTLGESGKDCARARDGAELASALYGYWVSSGLLVEGIYWLDRVLGRFHDPDSVRGWALVSGSALRAAQGDTARALTVGRAGLELADRLGEPRLQGYAQLNLCLTYIMAGRYEAAADHLAAARSHLTPLADRPGLAFTWVYRGLLAQGTGDLAGAVEAYHGGISFLGDMVGDRGERWLRGYLQLVVALVYFQQPGKETESARTLRLALLAKREFGEITGTAYALEVLGWLASRTGRHARAGWLLGAAEQLWRLCGGRLSSAEQFDELHQMTVAASRSVLGPGEFDALFARACARPLDDLVALAISDAEEPDAVPRRIPQPGSLTEREREVAFLAANGMSVEKIAESLFVSRHTVEDHLADVFAKLCVTSVAELTEWLGNEDPLPGSRLQVPPVGLLPLDRLEQGLEVALAEAEAAVPFDELEEDGGAVADRLGEDLQQVPVLVTVDENAAASQLVHGHPHLADARLEHRVGVVLIGRGQEFDAALGQLVHGGADVRRGEGQVLHARPLVELEVLVDLGLPLADGGLVERELHPVIAARHHLAHQRRVLGGDVLADELGHVGEAHDAVVEAHPLVHLAELDVADDVVQRDERRLNPGYAASRLVAGQVAAVVPGAVDEAVRGVAVGPDSGGANGAVLVRRVVRFLEHHRAGRPGLRDAPVHVRDVQGDVDDAVAVPTVVVGERAAGADGALDDEPDISCFKDICVVVAVAGRRPGVRLQGHPERQLEVQRRLRRVA